MNKIQISYIKIIEDPVIYLPTLCVTNRNGG